MACIELSGKVVLISIDDNEEKNNAIRLYVEDQSHPVEITGLQSEQMAKLASKFGRYISLQIFIPED